ncbi:MAG: hypothetical protein CM1200mP13_02680 [Candidatus Pelagibacterales bacterium]|nr:MAG: hypothetical protein CM1200mP13_02680 [Pelagibacterales bacterium]
MNCHLKKLKLSQQFCGSLREAMESLDKDREFLTQGGVFTEIRLMLTLLLILKNHKFEHAPHPVEFEMYYSS